MIPGMAILLSLALSGALAAPLTPGGVGDSLPREYEVKSAFLYNIAKFVDWPPAAFPTDSTSLVIGVLGNDPFGADLERVIERRTVNGRRVQVRRYPTLPDSLNCHILFISPSESDRLDATFEALGLRPVLTVGDVKDFCRRGGMVGLVLEEGSVRIEVSRKAARRVGLDLSSRLLQVARIVDRDQTER